MRKHLSYAGIVPPGSSQHPRPRLISDALPWQPLGIVYSRGCNCCLFQLPAHIVSFLSWFINNQALSKCHIFGYTRHRNATERRKWQTIEGEQGKEGRGEERVEERKQQHANRSRLFRGARGKSDRPKRKPQNANVLIKRASSEADSLVATAQRAKWRPRPHRFTRFSSRAHTIAL